MKYPDLNHLRWLKQFIVAHWRPDSKENRVFFWAFALDCSGYVKPWIPSCHPGGAIKRLSKKPNPQFFVLLGFLLEQAKLKNAKEKEC